MPHEPSLLSVLAAVIAVPLAAAAVGRPAPAPPSPPAAFARCTGCHSAGRGGASDIGPNLWGVAGSRAGTRPGYDYSPALKKTGLVWNRATLTRWLDNSQAVAPGTQMPNQHLKPADRDAIITYLSALK